MINIENIEEVSRLVIQAKDMKKENSWYTVSNIRKGTTWDQAILDMESWKKDFPNAAFRLIEANIIVNIETIAQL